MKISRILLLPALVILFGSMVSYDFELKKVYTAGTYKDPQKGMTPLNFKDFDTVEINSNMMGVTIQQNNTFSVGVRDNAKDHLKVTQLGKRLIIDLILDDDMAYGERTIAIGCPNLKELKLDAFSYINGKRVVRTDFSNTTVFVKGFKQDNLKISMNHASFAKLFNNQIGHLTADIGIEKRSPADLMIDNSNKIGSANLNILNNGKIALTDLPVDNFKCKISDSAMVRLTGASLKLIRQE